jgi:hypothetical protein
MLHVRVVHSFASCHFIHVCCIYICPCAVAQMLENVRRDLPALDYVDLHIPGGLPKRLASLKPWLQRLPGQQLTRLVLRPLANRDTGKPTLIYHCEGSRREVVGGEWRVVVLPGACSGSELEGFSSGWLPSIRGCITYLVNS